MLDFARGEPRVEPIYDVEQVAEKLGVKALTVREWLRTKQLVGFKIGKAWRVRESDLQAFVDKKIRETQEGFADV